MQIIDIMCPCYYFLVLVIISFGYDSMYDLWLKPKILQLTSIIEQKSIGFNVVDKLELFIVTNKYLICLFWFFGLSISILKLFFQTKAVYSVKESGVVDYGLLELKKSLIEKLEIKKDVLIKFIKNGSHPFTIGYWRPIIYFPIQAVTTFSEEELELILFHELIHIKRNDFLINLVQICVETIFFFNPFIIHISKIIKNEREVSCDFNVIKEGYSTLSYAKALQRSYKLHYDLSLSFGNQNVYNRVKNLTWFKTDSKKNNSYKNSILGLLFIGFLFIGFGFSISTKSNLSKKILGNDIAVYPRVYVNTDTLILQSDPSRHLHLYCEEEYAYYEDGILKNNELENNFSIERIDKGSYIEVIHFDKKKKQVIGKMRKKKDNSDWLHFLNELSNYCMFTPDEIVRYIDFAVLGDIYIGDERLPKEKQKELRREYPKAFGESLLKSDDIAFVKEMILELQKDNLLETNYDTSQVVFQVKNGDLLYLNDSVLNKKYADKYFIYLRKISGENFYELVKYRIK
ncbi:M56 family metallopeptidase [Aquimarina sp. Aq107]|uniref:M56 family metallopeptidase n=1 Tax=Aquimarina sp. Aq107 TaxID=1191912 RepID=UPI000D552DEA|nr:M56 family metallopeptidase [Aquimarina sp. Aq107]